MYSRGWPKGTNPGERLPKEGGTGDAKAKLPPLPIGAGVGAGAGGLAVPKRVGGGEMRSPSHGGAKAREAALAQVSSPSSKQVPPLPPGTRRRPADGTTASNNPIADGSSRSSQSPRRDSTGSVWMVRPPSGDGAASPRDNAIASPSRGRSVCPPPKPSLPPPLPPSVQSHIPNDKPQILHPPARPPIHAHTPCPCLD